MQQSFKITPHNVYISGVPGIGNYYLNPLHAAARAAGHLRACNLGAEVEVIKKRMGGMILRAGWALETSATPDETASVLTPDALRNVISSAAGCVLGPVRLDLGYAHIFFADRTVTNSRIVPAQSDPAGARRPRRQRHVTPSPPTFSPPGLEARF